VPHPAAEGPLVLLLLLQELPLLLHLHECLPQLILHRTPAPSLPGGGSTKRWAGRPHSAAEGPLALLLLLSCRGSRRQCRLSCRGSRRQCRRCARPDRTAGRRCRTCASPVCRPQLSCRRKAPTSTEAIPIAVVVLVVLLQPGRTEHTCHHCPECNCCTCSPPPPPGSRRSSLHLQSPIRAVMGREVCPPPRQRSAAAAVAAAAARLKAWPGSPHGSRGGSRSPAAACLLGPSAC